MVFEVVDKGFIRGNLSVAIHVVPIAVWVFESVGAVERVDANSGRVPRTEPFGFPAVREGVAIGVNEVGVGNRPRFGGLWGFAVVLKQVTIDAHEANDGPLVLAKVG